MSLSSRCMADLVSYFEVISSKTCVVHLQNDAGIVHRTREDLSPPVCHSLEIMPPSLTWGPFSTCFWMMLSSLRVSAFRLLTLSKQEAGGQAGIAYSAAYSRRCQTPAILTVRAPGPSHLDAGGVGYGGPGA